jgi:hypothetical protein
MVRVGTSEPIGKAYLPAQFDGMRFLRDKRVGTTLNDEPIKPKSRYLSTEFFSRIEKNTLNGRASRNLLLNAISRCKTCNTTADDDDFFHKIIMSVLR